VTDQITLADIERQIAHHQQAIADLRQVGIRLDEASALGGAGARRWLIDRGATNYEAQRTILAVLDERRAARGYPPVGQCSRADRQE